MENKETVKEPIITIDNEEYKESELDSRQKYLTNQCRDLVNKKARIEFELDQVQASLNVFQQALVESVKEKAVEVLNPEEDVLEEEK